MTHTTATESSPSSQPAGHPIRPSRRRPGWLEVVGCWLAVAVVLGLCAQAFRQNADEGLVGSTVAVPLTKVPAASLAPTMTTPVDALVPFSRSRSRVMRFTPISVVEGKSSDFNLVDPSAVKDMRFWYVTFDVTYVSGEVLPGPIPNRVQIASGKIKKLLVPNGLKNWNKSPCQPTKYSRAFSMGAGTTVTICEIYALPKSFAPSQLQLDNTAQKWPIER